MATITRPHFVDRVLDGLPKYDRDQAGHAINLPNWNAAHPPGDWRVYIPSSIQNEWDGLSIEARLVAYVIAVNRARHENT